MVNIMNEIKFETDEMEMEAEKQRRLLEAVTPIEHPRMAPEPRRAPLDPEDVERRARKRRRSCRSFRATIRRGDG